MAITPFKAQRFVKNDVITKADVDVMNANLVYINDNTPAGRFYERTGETHDVRTVLVAGRARIRKNKKSDDAVVRVRFPAGAFAPDCQPHITTGIVSEQTARIFCVVNGPDTTNYPNSTGFDVVVNIASPDPKKDKILKEFYVSWHAFGYRVDELVDVL